MVSAPVVPKPLCCACKQTLKPGAVKCHACGTDQRRWQRILITLGAVAAISSLFTIAVEQVRGMISTHEAVLVGAVSSIDGGAVRFAISNQGDRVATLMGAVVEADVPPGTCRQVANYATALRAESLQAVLEPGKTATLVGRAAGNGPLPQTFVPEAFSDPKLAETLEKRKNCRLNLTYVDHKSAIKQSSLSFSCVSEAGCL